jgi:DHA1 family inner membrane transport protein
VQLALAVGGFAIGTTEFATMSLLPYFAASLGIDAPTAGHVISAYALGVVVGAPVIAVLAARMQRRYLLVLLMALFALGNALSALAPSYGWMLAFRFLSGLPHGAYFGIASIVATSLVPVNKRTKAVGQILLGLTVATIIGVPLANFLGQAVGWRWSFGVVAALGLTAMTMVLIFAPRDTPDPQAQPARRVGRPQGAAGLVDPGDRRHRLRRALRRLYLSGLDADGGHRGVRSRRAGRALHLRHRVDRRQI